MITIVGLGNPGDAYKETRHNIGWIMLMHIIDVQGFPSPLKSSEYNALLTEGVFSEKEISILFPLTFMNHSGVSVLKYLKNDKDSKEVVVVHDDVDLPFGDVRVSVGRGAGGHNGVQSIIDALKTKDFTRIRVGVGKKNIFGMLKRPSGEALPNFVLSTFSPREQKQFSEISKKVTRALIVILTQGVTKAMQECNS